MERDHATISCDPITGSLAWNASIHTLRAAVRVHAVLPGGIREELQRAPWSISGMTSKRFQNERYVLKISDDNHMARREACLLRILRGTAVPAVICSRDQLLLMENAGEQLTSFNLPYDYREQAEAVLMDLRRRGVTHGDIWKHGADLNAPSLFTVDVLVNRKGRMTLIDFNTGTVNGSYACERGIRPTATKEAFAHSFTPSDDSHMLAVLDAQYLVNRTIATYERALGARVRRVRHGICRRESMPALAAVDPLSRDIIHLEPPAAERTEGGLITPETEMMACRGSRRPWRHATTGEFPSVFTSSKSAPGTELDGTRAGEIVHSRGQSLRMLPTAFNPMPSLSDVINCVERCKMCGPRCHEVSISTHRSVCAWFAPRASLPSPPPPHTFGRARPNTRPTGTRAPLDHERTCEEFGGDPPVLRTAWRRPSWAEGALMGNRTWEQYQRCDDFVTVGIRRSV